VRDSNELRTAIGNGISFFETFAEGSILRPRTIGGLLTTLEDAEPCTIGGVEAVADADLIGGSAFSAERFATALTIGGTDDFFGTTTGTGFGMSFDATDTGADGFARTECDGEEALEAEAFGAAGFVATVFAAAVAGREGAVSRKCFVATVVPAFGGIKVAEGFATGTSDGKMFVALSCVMAWSIMREMCISW